MTRPMDAGLLAAMEASECITGEILLLKARDGTLAAFTTLDVDMAIDLTGDGEVTFSEGFTPSALTLAVGLDASFGEFEGAEGAQLTRIAINGGKWDEAEAWFALVSPEVPGEFAPLLYGHVTEPRCEGERWVLEVRNVADRLSRQQGEVLSPLCRAELGDGRCTKVVTPLAATVTAVTDAMRFTVSFSGSYADDYFNQGTVTFTTGALAGGLKMDLEDWTSGGAIELREPLFAAPQIGDELEIRQGCPKTREACRDLFANAINFQGEPELPGEKALLVSLGDGS